MVDSAGKATEQQGKVEHHAPFWQRRNHRRRTSGESASTRCRMPRHSLLSVAGVSPMQLVFGRNPEIQGNVLSDNPDLIANSSSLAHDEPVRGNYWIASREASSRLLQNN